MLARSRGWTLTLGLSALALVAALLAPRAAAPEPALHAEADLCLRLGAYECCYVDEDARKPRP